MIVVDCRKLYAVWYNTKLAWNLQTTIETFQLVFISFQIRINGSVVLTLSLSFAPLYRV